MYTPSLNKQSGFFGFPLPNNRHLRYLAAEPMWTGSSEKLAEEFELEKVPAYPIAFSPPVNFPRILSQLSAFTMHPRPQEHCTIPELLKDEENLVRYVVPAECKSFLIRDLAALKITRRTLYPDLDGLCACLGLHNSSFVVAYTPPKPPLCGGLYNDSSSN